MPSIVGLIPARSGSQRIKDKNIKPLAGKPLIAWTIKAARDSGIFKDIVVSTDSRRYAKIAEEYGAGVPFERPAAMATGESADIEWVRHALSMLDKYDCFAILRPTNPFRSALTIQRAWAHFQIHQADSLRAVELCGQHPGKMWVMSNHGFMSPLLPFASNSVAWHSTPYQSLPKVYAQNASLEIAWSRVAMTEYSISGSRVMPFVTDGYEGFDINTPEDWEFAEWLVATGKVAL